MDGGEIHDDDHLQGGDKHDHRQPCASAKMIDTAIAAGMVNMLDDENGYGNRASKISLKGGIVAPGAFFL
jgi:hypothetical protein